MDSPIPLPFERAIRKLGGDISLARRRRHISQASLAERMGASLSTVRRMKKGDVKAPIHFFARALHVFGEIRALEHLLDTAERRDRTDADGRALAKQIGRASGRERVCKYV